MISNLYFWIFLAAVSTAAAFSSLRIPGKRKNTQKGSGSNRSVFFFIYLTISFCFFIGSVFFVDWLKVTWDWYYVWFFVAFVLVFYFSFVFKLVVGVPVFLSILVMYLFISIYLYSWNVVPSDGKVAQYRILSTTENRIRVELYGVKIDPLFIEKSGKSMSLELNTLKINSLLFFVNPGLYYEWSETHINNAFFEKIINYLADKTILLGKKIYLVNIGNKTILYLYSIILTPDNKIIIMEN